MKKDYLGECEIDGVSYSVLIIAENKEDAIKKYEHYMKKHKELTIPLGYKESIAELWFMEHEILPEESIKELKQYSCTVF